MAVHIRSFLMMAFSFVLGEERAERYLLRKGHGYAWRKVSSASLRFCSVLLVQGLTTSWILHVWFRSDDKGLGRVGSSRAHEAMDK